MELLYENNNLLLRPSAAECADLRCQRATGLLLATVIPLDRFMFLVVSILSLFNQWNTSRFIRVGPSAHNKCCSVWLNDTRTYGEKVKIFLLTWWSQTIFLKKWVLNWNGLFDDILYRKSEKESCPTARNLRSKQKKICQILKVLGPIKHGGHSSLLYQNLDSVSIFL